MTDTQFQQQVLQALSLIQTDVGTLKTDVGVLKTDVGVLKTDVSTLASEFHDFKDAQQQYNERMEEKTDALWSLSNQAFTAIADMSRKSDYIHQEVVSPWKRRQAKTF